MSENVKAGQGCMLPTLGLVPLVQQRDQKVRRPMAASWRKMRPRQILVGISGAARITQVPTAIIRKHSTLWLGNYG